ncbi:MAG TPA: A/G-specific adenine glycosylase [Solirubrobacteraceae bacterium]|nr:A/G-specific adenine glycosylase [Solirubrobacteraceae bacterium]
MAPQTWTVSDPPVATVLKWWDANARPLPWRGTRDVYGVWVSEVMSTQTQVERVAPAWSAWMRRWPAVQALAAAPLADVLGQWQGLGYPRRARDMHRSARIVADAGWPHDLTELPGVGAYIAAAVRCFALEQPVLPVDVNVRRVLRRRFGDGVVDTVGDPWRAGQALMEFGQRVCTTRPRCTECPVRVGCAGTAADPEPAAGRRQRPFAGSLRQRRGQLLRRVLENGAVAADGLVVDGLVVEGLDGHGLATGGLSADGLDAEAATSLVRDGLVVLADGRLLAPR